MYLIIINIFIYDMDIVQKQRLYTSLIVALKNKINFDVPEKLLDYFRGINYEFKINEDILLEKFVIKTMNYDDLISNYLSSKLKKNINLKEVLHETYNLDGIKVNRIFSNILDNNFISIRLKRDIINNLDHVLKLKVENREVLIVSKKYESKLLNDILSILDLFDVITNYKNKYVINVFLSEEKKCINFDVNFLNGDNINSGSTLPGYFITIWRREEIHKVLIHEIVHYLKLDMIRFQNKFHVLYKDIKLDEHKCNPNEAYTEFLAIIIFVFWKFKKNNVNNDKMRYYFNTSLTLELAWSFFQISKILLFFQCYDKYEDLFNCDCIFFQKTNVLSYFILKTFLLFDMKNTVNCIDFVTLKQNKHLTDSLLKNINLNNKTFVYIIDWCLKYYKDTKYKFNHSTLRMTCLD